MTKRLFIVFNFFIAFLSIASAQSKETYQRVKIKLDAQHPIAALAALGIETDHGAYLPNRALTTDLSGSELAQVRAAGFETRIVIEDLKTWYSSPRPSTERSGCNPNTNNPYQYQTPVQYQPGSYGGYFRYQEMLNILDSMRLKYPNLVTAKAIITDTISTHQGRPLYWVKISDNANANEPESQVLYTAVHHAREPNSMSQMIFYMWYLLEHYGNDQEVKYIVDNTEMYFVPCVNPDGYLQNELTDPAGGGFWRKNMRDNLDGTFGVDINRNYGFQWGYDDVGSSPNTNSAAYRGPAGFSEPETRMMKLFCEQHQFKFALNYHTFGNLLIYPWAWSDAAATPEFIEYGKLLAAENKFKYGVATETVGYQVNGSSDDYMYGDKTIISFTPEVGFASVGFWPPATDIDNLNKSCMKTNLLLAELPLKHAEASSFAITASGATQGQLTFDVKRYGLAPGDFTVSVQPNSANVTQILTAPKILTIAHLASQSVQFDYSLAPNIKNGDTVRFLVRIDNGTYTNAKEVEKVFASQTTSLSSDPMTTLSGWQTSGTQNWDLTSETFFSAPTSCTDSPNADYTDNTVSMIKTNVQQLIPANAISATLRYKAKWELEEGFDYVTVNVGEGAALAPQCATSTGITVAFVPTTPVYSGYQADWSDECVDLLPYKGKSVNISFDLVSDEFITADGFYFDDLEIVYTLATGTQHIALDDVVRLTISPNPSTDILQISWDASTVGATQIQLFDGLGRELKSIQLNKNDNKCTMQISDVPKAAYRLVLRLDNGQEISGQVQKQ